MINEHIRILCVCHIICSISSYIIRILHSSRSFEKLEMESTKDKEMENEVRNEGEDVGHREDGGQGTSGDQSVEGISGEEGGQEAGAQQGSEGIVGGEGNRAEGARGNMATIMTGDVLMVSRKFKIALNIFGSILMVFCFYVSGFFSPCSS